MFANVKKPSRFRIRYVGKPGPASPLPPRSDGYRTEGGQLLTFAGIASATTVGGFGFAGRKAAPDPCLRPAWPIAADTGCSSANADPVPPGRRSRRAAASAGTPERRSQA